MLLNESDVCENVVYPILLHLSACWYLHQLLPDNGIVAP